MGRKSRSTRSREKHARSSRPDEVAIFRKRLTFVAVLATLVVLVVLDRAGMLVAPTSDGERYDGATVSVVRVIDGDTIVIDLADPKNDYKPTRIRVWGIDTPELALMGKPAEAWATESKEFAAGFLGAGPVILRLEVSRERDRWGRVLAHVELENGDLLAAALLEAGLARAEDRWPHRWDDWYSRIERDAKRDGAGMWAN